MSSIGHRLREERERLGLNQSEFAAAGGASKRSQIAWEQGQAFPNAEFLLVISQLGVDVNYVLTGEFKVVSLSQEESALVSAYRLLDIRGKAGVLGMISGLTTPSESTSISLKGSRNYVVQGDSNTITPPEVDVQAKKKKKP